MIDSELDEIYKFLAISDLLGSAGQPTEAQFEWVKEAGYEVVINLAMPTQPQALANEAEIVRGLGMEYISIPVVFNNPTSEDLDRATEALAANAERKCFVHCIANARVSAFIYLYRVLRLGIPQAEAEKQLLQVWQPNDVWAQFIATELAARMGKSEDSGESPTALQ